MQSSYLAIDRKNIPKNKSRFPGNMSQSAWEKAYLKQPNYTTNVDLDYPYSDLPYQEGDDKIKLQLADHIDYWGEGRIVVPLGSSGFPDCYNVNRQYQLVSNGPDEARRIPNRIPVIDENHCDSSIYVGEDSTLIVTLMGAPIIRACAQDIARMVNREKGMVVVYGFSDDSQDIKNFKEELQKKSIFFSFAYTLPERLRDVSLFNNHHSFLNATDLGEELYNNITGADYVKAVEIFKTLDKDGGGSIATDIVNRILTQGITNTTKLVYHLWNEEAREIVVKYFPKQYELIFNEDTVKITNIQYGVPLKLDVNITERNDRLAWGDDSDKTTHRLQWKFRIEAVGSTVTFKIVNQQFDMFMTLDENTNPNGDRKAWGSESSDEEKHTWNLDPIKVNDQLLFFIVNREYQQGLKLDAETDSYGDRLVWGNNGNVADDPEHYGWLLEAL